MTPPALHLDPHAGSTPLANQVAGHPNVLSDASGSLVIKPALPREIAFYHLLNSASRRQAVSKLKPLVPTFFGTLRLEGQLDAKGSIVPSQSAGGKDEVPESVVLENLAHLYTHPSILDAKLGRTLTAEDASEEKRIRMEKQAKESTTYETGLRLTGSQTWHAPSSSYILTPKSYGKTIKTEQLPEGFARFMPLPNEIVQAIYLPPTPVSSTSTTPASAAIPHLPLPPVPSDTLTPTPTSASSSTPPNYTSHAIPPKTLLRVLAIIDYELEQLENVLKALEARFVGSSVLIIYEGDPARLEDALDRWEARQAKLALVRAEGLGQASDVHSANLGLNNEEDDEDDEDEDDESLLDGQEEDEDSSTSSDDDEDDGARADARRARRCPPVTVKMIDFAHTRLAEGEGPDEGVLKGLDTLRGLVKGRAEVVRKAVYEGK